VAGTIAVISPPLVDQTTNFVNNLPAYLRNPIISKFINDQTLDQTMGQLSSVPGQVVKVGVSIFSNLVGIMSVFIFTFYLLLYRGKLDEQVSFFFGEDGKAKFGRVLDMIENSLGGWARGQLILMLSIGVLTFIGLTILGIPYSLPLAVLAGILEIVPTIGPIIAAIPMIIVALTISPIMGFGTVALAFLIHQSENYLLVPKIMEKSVGVNPIVTLASLAIGFRLMGIIGALVSVPVVLTIQIIIKEYLQNK
jgi:predicted PurR-regulated permease PerM